MKSLGIVSSRALIAPQMEYKSRLATTLTAADNASLGVTSVDTPNARTSASLTLPIARQRHEHRRRSV